MSEQYRTLIYPTENAMQISTTNVVVLSMFVGSASAVVLKFLMLAR